MDRKQNKTSTVHAYADAEIKDMLRKLAEANDRSMSAELQNLIKTRYYEVFNEMRIK